MLFFVAKSALSRRYFHRFFRPKSVSVKDQPGEAIIPKLSVKGWTHLVDRLDSKLITWLKLWHLMYYIDILYFLSIKDLFSEAHFQQYFIFSYPWKLQGVLKGQYHHHHHQQQQLHILKERINIKTTLRYKRVATIIFREILSFLLMNWRI